MRFTQRTPGILTAVVLIHVGGLWALQSGLLRRSLEIITPAEVLIDVSPASAEAAPPAPVSPPVPTPANRVTTTQAQQPTAPQSVVAASPLASVAPTAAPSEPSALAPAAATAATSTGALSASAGSPPAASTGTAAPRAPALELPSSDADYLNNPRPAYPPLSKRLREEGKVVIRTLIGVDGTAQQAQIKQSSGFERLDQAALATALKWRYAPGKRSGVAEAMWFDVPFNWVLQ
jgi:protein TonB